MSTYSHCNIIRSCTHLGIEPRPSPSQTLDVFDGVFHSALALSKDIRLLACWATLDVVGSSCLCCKLNSPVFFFSTPSFSENVGKPFRAAPSPGTVPKDTLCAFKAWVNVELTTYVATFMTYSNV